MWFSRAKPLGDTSALSITTLVMAETLSKLCIMIRTSFLFCTGSQPLLDWLCLGSARWSDACLMFCTGSQLLLDWLCLGSARCNLLVFSDVLKRQVATFIFCTGYEAVWLVSSSRFVSMNLLC